MFYRIKSIWDHRFSDLRFVQMEHLTNRHGDPLFPQDTKERVYEQCRTARNILLKVVLSIWSYKVEQKTVSPQNYSR